MSLNQKQKIERNVSALFKFSPFRSNIRVSKLTKLEREYTNLQLKWSEIEESYKNVAEENAKLLNQIKDILIIVML